MAHLNFVGYNDLPKIFIPQEVKGDIIPSIVVIANVNKLKYNSKTQQRPEGESPSQVLSQPSRPSSPSSSNKRISQRKTNAAGESNEEFS